MSLLSLPLEGADIGFDPHWLSRREADDWFTALRAAIAWETHRIRIYGRLVDSPRQSCWIGDAGTEHTYSGTRFAPHPWPEALLPLRAKVSQAIGEPFNSVLANLYRDGRDSMGWHSDDEPELGAQPVIASINLGAARRFSFKHRRDAEKKLALDLLPGSLLVMRGDTQKNYRHALPKTAKPVGERINLTFRRIIMPSPERGGAR